MIKRFKEKWKIKSNFQLLLILAVFSITGSTTVYLRRQIFELIGIGSETALWIKIPLYIIIIFPLYQMMFLIVGTLFGQFKFAWEFEKKVFNRFIPKKK